MILEWIRLITGLIALGLFIAGNACSVQALAVESAPPTPIAAQMAEIYGEGIYFAHANRGAEFLRGRAFARPIAPRVAPLLATPYLGAGVEATEPIEKHSCGFIDLGMRIRMPTQPVFTLFAENRGRWLVDRSWSNEVRLLLVNHWLFGRDFLSSYGETLLSSAEWNTIFFQRLTVGPQDMRQGLSWAPDFRWEGSFDRLGHYYYRYWRVGLGLGVTHRAESFSQTLRIGAYRISYVEPHLGSEPNPYSSKPYRLEALYTVGASW